MICLYIYMRRRYTSLSLQNTLVSVINSYFVRYKESGLEINIVQNFTLGKFLQLSNFNSTIKNPFGSRDAADI